MRIISNRLVQLAACAAFVAATAPLGAESKTLKGEVVDTACFTKDKGNVGDKHKDCGLTCVKKGAKLSFVTPDGQVYPIVGAYTENKNEKIVEFFAIPVEATGEVTAAKELKITALKKVS
jgi:hypothetical protein